MALTQLQRDDLHKAIYDYFVSQQLNEAASSFAKETQLNPTKSKVTTGSSKLESKWTNLLRLQKKVMDQQKRIQLLEDELDDYKTGEIFKKKPSTVVYPHRVLHDCVGHRAPLHAVAIHPSEPTIATAGSDCTIKLWHALTGELVRSIQGHRQVVTALCWMPLEDAVLLVSASADLTIRLFNPSTPLEESISLTGHQHTVSDIAVWKTTLISVSRDCSIRYWDGKSKFRPMAVISDAHDTWIRCCAVSSSRLVTGGGKDVKVWNALTRKPLHLLAGHTNIVEDVCFIDSNPSLCASCSRDKTIRIWNIDVGGASVFVLTGHDNWVRSIISHHDFLISASDDRSIRLWDIQKDFTLSRFLPPAHTHFVQAIDFSSTLFASVSSDK
eukprot:CAMPEP_0117422412 /NCGR_PEP_ID=MMETSP0758-20121206/3256_1 /TAXON_ID=63605 /ORGANISM="Percolomonas cosmopolitus, Strain AE-1 (ATCC 50343)" /LENGTH=383 /DNA_ID=CAMNT_0005205015 /DNA_START=86 /DNA_END=1234 /DNA_ORIENTATION=-